MSALVIGTVLHGKYRIDAVLGNGGFGITYLAQHMGLNKQVVIKEFFDSENAYRTHNRETVEYRKADAFGYGLTRFKEEAQLLAQFEHGNIVKVQDCFDENGTSYFVMPYYQGQTLAEFLQSKGGKIDEETALKLFRPIIDGLQEAHRKGILHRDIKPDNIYLVQTEFGGLNPILIDFGAARYEIAQQSKQLTGIITKGYAPLEQYGTSQKQGAWTDIYALTATLHHCLLGRRPPEATERILGEELRIPSSVSPQIKQILEKGFALYPKDRYQNLNELVKELFDLDKKGLDITITSETICPSQISSLEFKYVPAGKMSVHPSTPDVFVIDCNFFEFKVGFYMMIYPVTQFNWIEVMAENPAELKGDENCPIESVSYLEVLEFIERLNMSQSLGRYRLPTRFEWEYVCRCGTDTNFYWGNTPDNSYMNFGDLYTWTTNVRNHPPNLWGFYDMNGNVKEICLLEDEDHYITEAMGGSWHSLGLECAGYHYEPYHIEEKSKETGFRLIFEL